MERCIREVKARGNASNPWAVCQHSVGCALPRKPRRMRTSGQTLETMPEMEEAIHRLLEENRETIIRLNP